MHEFAHTPRRPFVVKLSGTAVEHPFTRADLWHALARAHAQAGLALVHGGGNALDHHLTRLGMTTHRRDGIRLTPPDQMPEVAAVLAGRLNKTLVGAMLAAGAPAVGLAVGDGAALRCVRTSRYGFDAGQVGEIVGGDARLMRVLLDAGYLPVVSSIGFDDAGTMLNINADDAAVGLAAAVNASALVLLTDVPGVLDAAGNLIPQLEQSAVEDIITSRIATGGMIPKLRAAALAAARTRLPAVIASYDDPESLVRLFRGEPCGTRILPPSGPRDPADHAFAAPSTHS
ncbi:MAG: acetylglutamate kinase [Phycisphaeraceae bacterium]|nr:acetylglutamate kinase [Phycisphaeraceae bacterium]